MAIRGGVVRYTLVALVGGLLFAPAGCDREVLDALASTVANDPPPAPDQVDDPSVDIDDDADNADGIPQNAYCDSPAQPAQTGRRPVADWPGAWRALETEVLELVNENRAAGADCGSYGYFGPTGPLAADGTLRCAARAHSMDMDVRDFFSHTNPDGDGPGQRLDAAGYAGSLWGENIAWGYASPTEVVSGWMASDGHCANIMRSQFTLIGVGYHEGNYWTQTFGAD